MREYLFHGQRVDNGEWVYGSPIFQDAYVLIRFWNSEEFEYEEHLVAPESVGEWTGLTDKNGKKIFEGDILEFSDRLVYVFWHAHLGCWDCQFLKYTNKEAGIDDMSPINWDCKSKVIGNIHDNPELLEG